MAKHRKGHGGWLIAGITLGVLVLLGAGSAYAAYRYDASTAAQIMPGVTVAGVDVSGMTQDEAIRLVTARAEETLYDDLSITAAGQTWTVTPAALGMTADVEAAIARALAVADDMSFLDRVYHRVREIPVDVGVDLSFSSDPADVEAFVRQIADEIAIPAVNAKFALVDEATIVKRRSQPGRELQLKLAASRILRALDERANAVTAPIRLVEPTRPTSALGQTIVVDVSDNHLWFYEGLKLVKEYDVATGTASYPTPVGSFEIVDKKENPTWVNPDPDGWGAGLPASIGPGPGNPLGTRAMYLNAPGIRIHGTWDSSSIGTAASHGCIRMHVEDSEELYPLVDIGARVLVKP